VVAGAFTSLTRGGTESVVFTNAAQGDVFYVGVKSEDQQSGEYGLVVLSTDQPFDKNRNGSRVLQGLPVPQPIPDGSPAKPGRATVFAIGLTPITVRRVTAQDVLTHEDVGDLSVILSHQQNSVVLHNHTLNNGFFNVTNVTFNYDDEGFGHAAAGVRHSDGPGSLNSFVGTVGSGVWIMNFIDNAPTHTGTVQNVEITLDPFVDGNLAEFPPSGVSGSVGPQSTTCFFVDVPPQATNMVLTVSQLTGPLQLYLRQGTLPDTNTYDETMALAPPGGAVTVSIYDKPIPLQAGRYYVCLDNAGDVIVNFNIALELQIGVGLDFQRTVVGTNALVIPDNGVVTSTIDVPVDKQVADVQVAVRIDHPRSSDLVLHLISAQGTRLLLAENRGGSGSTGYGSGYGTNMTYTVFTENTNQLPTLVPIKFALPPWTNSTTATNPVTFDGDFEGAVPGVYGLTQSLAGWSVSQGSVTVIGPTNSNGVPPQHGTNFVALSSTNGAGSILASFGTIPGQDYLLNFWYQRNPAAPASVPQGLQVYFGAAADLRPPVKFLEVESSAWQSTNFVFTATNAQTDLEFGSLTGVGPLLDNVTVSDVVVTTNSYVLPEEPLSVLQGERALGNWTLEVSDDRTGPVGNPGTLLNWQLQIQYGSPRSPAIVITNGVTVTNLIAGSVTNYYMVDVCNSSSNAFATLVGPHNLLNLYVSRTGFPSGIDALDEFQPVPNDLLIDDTGGFGAAAFALSSDPHQPAPLVPGGRLYFAISNQNPGETNAYSFQVSFDRDTCTTPPIIRLQSDVPYTNVVAPSRSIIDYYVFNVSPIATEARFELSGNADLGMVLHYGLPLPDLTTFDYRSDNPGITNELIVVTNTSSPVPLQPGDWYIGVYNNTTNAAVYTVTASEIVDTNLNAVTLTNSLPVDFTIGPNAQLTNYFVFKVFDPVPGIKFELYNLTGDAALLIGYNVVPDERAYFLSNSASPTSPLTLEIYTNGAANLPELTGDWVLAVVNEHPTNSLSFSLRASLIAGTNQPPGTNTVINPEITVNGTNLCFSWPSTAGLQYELQGVTTVTDTNWVTVYGPVTATNTLMNYCVGLPSSYSFFRALELGGSGGTNQPPPSSGAVIDPSLSFGTTNGLCLSWPSQSGTQYEVQGKLNISDAAWTNIFGPVTATGPLTSHCLGTNSPYHFFQIATLSSSGNGGTSSSSDVSLQSPAVLANGQVELVWGAQIGVTYQVQFTTNLTPVVRWTTLTNLVASTASATFTDTNNVSGSGMRFYRVVRP
jgi:subtilisin-like proprotein convertase family protein